MEKLVYYDYCGTYRIVCHRDGTATLYHRLATNGQRIKVGDFKSVTGAKRGLSCYCAGMPMKIK